ncbi:MAG TPA: hypothetical protein VL485_27035 [Ktedonobacteraceae bacterium]|jgi:hypothetical protein|nr:hypothetical protein [Ktedonobacteraceae bacterium]
MTRHLYRFYLYAVFIALLIYGTVAIEMLLNTLLLLTPLRASYATAPSASTVIQSTIFTLVSLLIAGALAGLHYWLIRRDIRNDPDAGGSAIRALFLNLTEAISIGIAVPVFGFGALYQLGASFESDTVSGFAVALPILALAGLIELERRRIPPAPGAATTLQRLHLYIVQLFLLAFFATIWIFTLTQLIDGLFFTGANSTEVCGDYSNGCSRYHPLFLILALLWGLVFWVLYCWATRNDKSPLLRLIVQYISLATGISFIIAGLFQIIQILFLDAFHLAPSIAEVFGPSPINNFIAPLTLGIIVLGLSHYWLLRAREVGLVEQKGLLFAEYAFLAILAGGVFWWGCGSAIYHLLETLTFDGREWASVLALIISGVGYIPFDLYLRKSNRQGIAGAASPRRGLVLALLGGGILAFAIGGATALYAWITALLGSPITNWQQTAHAGLAAFLVGAILLIVYLQAARHEHLFITSAKSTPEPITETTTPEPPATIEQILDALLAGKMTRDEAATKLRLLESPQETPRESLQEPLQPKPEDQEPYTTEKPVSEQH